MFSGGHINYSLHLQARANEMCFNQAWQGRQSSGGADPQGVGISAQALLIVPQGQSQEPPVHSFNFECVSH